MTVYFVGAGPGAPDLITVRGLKLIERCPLCLYAGSLVPREIIAAAPKEAMVIDSAALNLDEIVALMVGANERSEDVARVHSGDPSIYGATGEQMRRLDQLNIPFEVVPGVPAFAGAAARINAELTLPEISQTIILTRTPGKASAMPDGERLEILGRSGATLAIHLSIRNLSYVQKVLSPFYGEDCPVIIAYRATWPDEKFIHTDLSRMRADVRAAKITRTALIFVGWVFDAKNFRNSALYDSAFSHVLRNQGKKKNRDLGAGS
ncbi:Precorrin-4 C(11)-methyltransferase [hydrothermal vent metagenome]|uniref:Precorrin-4 C(11)-methyltransferase n=1 Tax=hydrothermal vent metagenome TaxID=652676 RepID=A0A3B0TV09_9ZZZZ